MSELRLSRREKGEKRPGGRSVLFFPGPSSPPFFLPLRAVQTAEDHPINDIIRDVISWFSSGSTGRSSARPRSLDATHSGT